MSCVGKGFDIASVFGSAEVVDVPISHQRDINTVTAEIRTLTAQARGAAINYAIEIGRRLVEAKEMLPHGQWGDWLKNEVDFKQSTANNFMRIFREYGDSQTTMLGEPKSQTFGNLSVSHAIKLLAIPEDERESFVEEHRVEELSARELERLIKERDQATKSQTAAEEKAEKLACDLANAEARATQAVADAETLRKKLKQEEARAEKLAKAAADELASAKKAKAELKEARENPKIPADTLELLRRDAEAAAEVRIQQAEHAAQVAEDALQRIKRQLSVSDTDSATFGAYFTVVQEDFNRLHGVLLKIKSSDAAKYEKLRGAMLSLLSNLEGRLTDA